MGTPSSTKMTSFEDMQEEEAPVIVNAEEELDALELEEEEEDLDEEEEEEEEEE